MTKNRWQKIEQILDTALALSPDERTEYVEQICKDDAELKASVTELLQSIDNSEGFLDESADLQNDLIDNFSQYADDVPGKSSMVGKRIGPYKLVELIDHGGMGSVFAAERVDGNFKQRVALKIIRQGMDTPSNIARFKREQNILANLNHPHIAQLYDGGIIKDGLPYLVMEYVDGTPIDQYCRENELSITERLELFKKVCKAIQHAHHNLVIHRDLKPENILVKKNGTVKILDFGISKLLKPNNEESIYQTRPGGRILTLGYAAPEQLSEGSITTGTDIYTLGILLYKLLTDEHPFDFEGKSISEIEQIIRNEKPRRLSKSNLYDLDAIVQKSMRNKAQDRYHSAGELLDDLQRFEEGMPVLALQGSTVYRIKKYARRYKRSLLAAFVFLLTITSIPGYYTWQIAEERNQAQIEAQKAETVTTFLINMFDAGAPASTKGKNVTVEHFLEFGREKLDEMDSQPKTKAVLLATLGKVYRKLNDFEKSKTVLEEAVKISEKVYSEPHHDLANVYITRATLEKEIENFEEAIDFYNKALDVIEEMPDQPDTLYSVAKMNLALLYEETGNLKKAIPLHQENVRLLQKIYPPDHEQIGIGLNHQALAQRKNGDLKKAEQNYERALQILTRKLGNNHTRTITTTHNLASVYRDLGRTEKALSLEEKALAMRINIFGNDHYYTASSYNLLGHLYREKGLYDKSIDAYNKSLNILSDLYGDSSMYVGMASTGLAKSYLKEGNSAKADALFHKSLGILEQKFGLESRYLAYPIIALGNINRDQDWLTLAEEYYQKARTIVNNNYTAGHIIHADFAKEYGRLKVSQDSLGRALDSFRASINILKQEQKLPDTHWKVAEAKLELGHTLYQKGKFLESQQLLQQNIPIISELRGKDDPTVIRALNVLEQISD